MTASEAVSLRAVSLRAVSLTEDEIAWLRVLAMKMVVALGDDEAAVASTRAVRALSPFVAACNREGYHDPQ